MSGNISYNKTVFYKEMGTSSMLLKHGLRALQEISGSNNFYHLPMLLLSQGMERLMKCIMLAYNTDDDLQPISKPIIKKNHDLLNFLKNIILIHEKDQKLSTYPATRADRDFLNNDITLHEIIYILGRFAEGGRYYNLDVIDGKNYSSPEDLWSKMELRILEKHSVSVYNEDYQRIFEVLIFELVPCIERAIRAIIRMCTLGDSLGDFIKGNIHPFYTFLFLQDKQLGSQNYKGLLDSKN